MRKILLSILLAISVNAFSQTDLQLGVAHGNILDTYLSPEEYTGVELLFVATTQKNREQLTHLFQHEASFANVENRAGNATELAGMYRFRYGLLTPLTLTVPNLTLRVGAQAAANIGFLYNLRNSNNPAQGRAGVQIGPAALADYSFRVFNLPLALHYQASVPTFGLMFSPNYGQSYYEIFARGNYDHNIVPTTIIATPSLRHALSLSFPIARRTFTIGYLGDYDQYKVNNLKYHNYTHAIMLGITLSR